MKNGYSYLERVTRERQRQARLRDLPATSGAWFRRACVVVLIVLCCVVLGMLLSSCAGTVATYRDGTGQRVWQISGATAGSKLPEGSNRLTVTVLDDGTSELVMGGGSTGAEAAGVPPEVLRMIGEWALRGYLPVPGLEVEP